MDEVVDFLRAVLPSQGMYCITTLSRESKYASNMPFVDIATAASYAKSNATRANVYFALSSFRVEGKFSRKANMAEYQRALWLDLDCDGGKAANGEQAYASKTEAMRALGAFLKTTGLPWPMIVDSGNGFHLYWTFTRDVPTKLWKAMANMLRKVCDAQNLKADHHRTTDAASVLRVPGTQNLKNTPKPVRVLRRTNPCTPELMAKVLAVLQKRYNLTPSTAPINTTSTQPMSVEGLSFGSEFTTIPKDMPPRSPEQMIIKCRQIRDMGASPYGAWYQSIRVLLHTTATDELIHLLSKRNGRKYDAANCQAQIDALRADMSIGPCTCETLARENPKGCEGCPFRGKVKTPWSLAVMAKPKAVEMPKSNIVKADFTMGMLPVTATQEKVLYTPYYDETYRVSPGQGIFKTEYDDNDIPHSVQITENEIYIHTLCVNTIDKTMPQRTYIVRKVVPGCAPVDIPFNVEDSLGSQKIEMWAAQCGLLPHPRYKKDFFNFMNTYLASIQNKLPEVYVRNHFGWVDCTDRTTGEVYPGFIIGSQMYTKHGTTDVRLDDRAASVAQKIRTKGSLEEWKKVPALYKTLDQKFAQLLMCAAFGAPLMKFGLGTATNVAFSSWEPQGGKGKSSLLKALASVWGDPQQMLMGRTDTHAARFQQYSVYRNIPILIDEMTGISDDETASMLYDIVNGKEKARSTSTGTGLAQSGHWDTVTVFTSNQSMYEALKSYRVQSQATCMRVIEAVCDFKDYSGRPEALEINAALSAARDNYGLAGQDFISFIMRQPNIGQVVGDYAEQFANRYTRSADERFWLYGIAIPLIAGRIACARGLLNYDMDALTDYCVNTLLPSLREKVKTEAPTGSNLLTDFLNDNLSSTLIVQAHTRRDFMQVKDTIKPEGLSFSGPTIDPYIVQLPVKALLIRRELLTNTVYVSTRALTAWCKSRLISLDVMISDLKSKGLIPPDTDNKRAVLGKEVTALPQSSQRVYVFKLKGDVNES